MIFPSNRRDAKIPAFVEKLLGPLELIALTGVITGFALKALHLNGADEILMVAMSVLAGVYFLNGFRILNQPAASSDQTEQPAGFLYLLGTSISTKIAWIAMAVVVNGTLFGLLHLNGAGEMLAIGLLALASSTIIMFVYMIINRDKETGVGPTLLRAVPVFVIGLYLFLNLPV